MAFLALLGAVLSQLPFRSAQAQAKIRTPPIPLLQVKLSRESGRPALAPSNFTLDKAKLRVFTTKDKLPLDPETGKKTKAKWLVQLESPSSQSPNIAAIRTTEPIGLEAGKNYRIAFYTRQIEVKDGYIGLHVGFSNGTFLNFTDLRVRSEQWVYVHYVFTPQGAQATLIALSGSEGIWQICDVWLLPATADDKTGIIEAKIEPENEEKPPPKKPEEARP